MLFKPGDKRLIEDFEQLCDVIKSTTGFDPLETSQSKKNRIKNLLNNYEAFCEYYFPEYCFAPFSWFQKMLFKIFLSFQCLIFLAQWSRGFAKSTHFGLFIPLFLKFNDKLTGMIVGSYNNQMASEKLEDIRANLQSNQRIINDFGVQQSFGNWEKGLFKTRDDVGFYAFGKEQSPRGTRFKWKRPNYALVDDLNDARQLKNPAIAEEDKRWVQEELKPALWTRCWWLVVAQNKFHDRTVTALLEDDEEIKTKVHKVNIVNDKGESNWPENPDFSKEAIASLRESEGAGYIRERMNTPFEEGTTFKAEWLNEWVDMDYRKYKSTFIHYLDPSYKSTDKSDYKFWVLLAKNGQYYDILDAWGEKTTSKNMWEHAYDIEDEYEDATISHSMEANFIQEDYHKKERERVEEDKGRVLRLQNDRRAKGDKFERIQSLQPLFQRRLVRFNKKKAASPGMKLLRSQLLAIEKGSRINDDGPDALEGAIWIADKYTGRTATSTRGGKFKKKTNRSI